MFRFLLEIRDPLVLVGDHDAEALCLFHRNRHDRDRHIRIVLLVEVEHGLIVHLVDVIARENQHIVRVVGLHVGEILVNGVRRAGVPLGALLLFIGRKNRDAADQLVQIPRNSDADVRIELERHVLGQHAHGVNTGIDAVREREIDDAVLSAERHGRLCHLRGQNSEPASLAAGKQHGYHFFLDHTLTSNAEYFLSQGTAEMAVVCCIPVQNRQSDDSRPLAMQIPLILALQPQICHYKIKSAG